MLLAATAPLLIDAAWADIDNRPILVLRIDDCSTSWNTPFVGLGGLTAMQYAASKHIPITWAIITSLASSGRSLTWAQLKAYLDANGGEPASHSVDHTAMSSQQGHINEVINSKAAIEANLPGYHCYTFLQPGTWTGDAYMNTFAKLDNPIGQAIQATYAQSRAYLGGGWTIGERYYLYGSTNQLAIDAPDSLSIPALNALLDILAATPGLTFSISGHAVQETGGRVSYSVPADILKATIDKLADLRDQGKVRLMGTNDAFHADLSSDLNHVPDPGFKLSDPSLLADPWRLYSSAQLVTPGGVGDSRYCSLPNGSAVLRSTFLSLPPGRYEMTWYQRVINSKQNSGLAVAFANFGPSYVGQSLAIDWLFVTNASPNTWEKKTALALVPDRMNGTQLMFQPAPSGGYGVDNVSVVSAPVDPNVSPSASTATPSPGQCVISWRSPTDPAVTWIMVRCHSKTHPLTTTSGTLLFSLMAQPGVVQQSTISVDWSTSNYVYYSIFGLKSDGSFTPPDIAVVKVDRSPPTNPVVNCTNDPDGTLHAQWSSSEPESQIIQYEYAVGTSPGNDNIRRWTSTTDPQATITGVRPAPNTYVSVRAQNTFGFWSNIGYVATCAATTIGSAVQRPDGVSVAVFGTVTAVFGNCCYIEDNNRERGIKILGNLSTYHEGDYVMVTGSLATINGERCINAQ